MIYILNFIFLNYFKHKVVNNIWLTHEPIME
jgi:hypothetical protein